MKFIILAALCLSVTCSKTKEDADRREGISYSTSVVHSDPNFPDQQAQSSIDFKLETPDFNPKHPQNGFYQKAKEPTKNVFHGNLNEQLRNVPAREGYSSLSGNGPPPDKFYSSNVNAHHDLHPGESYYGVQKDFWPQPSSQKSSFRYNQPQISKGMYPQIYSHPQFGSKTKQFTSASNNKPVSSSFPSSTNSQSFNVGYSVKFGGGGLGKPYKGPRLESDVITGSRKEEVVKPLEHKIKSQKYSKPISAGLTSSHILSQSHITPKTQKQLAFLETIQGTSKAQKDDDSNIKNNSPWKSLSPSVEIYKSREVSLNSDPYNGYFDGVKGNAYYDNQNANSDHFEHVKVNPSHFDHQRALGKSEGFDYTNAVDFAGISASNVHQFMQPTIYDKQMNKPVTVQANQYTSTAALYSFANQGNAVKPQLAIGNLNSAANSQQQQQSLLNIANNQPQSATVNFNLNSQTLTNTAKGQIPKLPMDTSLLRDPVLTVDKQNLKIDSSKIPIHFDTTLIKQIGTSYGALYNDAQGGFDVKDIKLKDSGYKPNDSDKEGTKIIQSYDQPLNDQEVNPNSKPDFEYKTNQYDQNAFNSQTESAYSAKPEGLASAQYGSENNQHTHQFENEQNFYSQNTPYAYDSQKPQHAFGNDFQSEQNAYNTKTNPSQDQKSNKFESFNQQYENNKSNNFENFNEQYESDDMKFAFPQNGLFNPSLQKMPKSPPKKTNGEYYRLRKPNMYMVKEPVEEAAQQPPAQFKVFGKPPNTFMRHEYEKFQKTRNPEKPRQPRINPKRIIRDYNLETDLKPPPLHYNRPRRMHKYETH